MNLYIRNVWISLIILGVSSCKKFVDVQPPITQLVSESVYSNTASASAAVTGIYATMIGNSIGGGSTGISSLLGLSADELKLYPTTTIALKQAYTNELLSTTLTIPEWSNLYNCIYQANLALEKIKTSKSIPDSMKNQLLGESKFIRAFCYFYLQNIYGDVPLALSSDFKKNAIIARSLIADVYNVITSDLIDAQSLLGDDYRASDGSVSSIRTRPNKAAATALLARVYLYLKKWNEAETQATSVIGNSNYQLISNLKNVFLASNNSETIWELESRNNGANAPDGGTFLAGYLNTAGPSSASPILLSDTLLNSFETNDLRKASWTIKRVIGSNTYYFPYKYKLGTTNQPPVEYPILFRLAELYLIRAEARAQLNNLSDAKADLNIIRNRANLLNTSALTQSDLLVAIQQERRLELFTEYGHRWLDLKRTGTIDAVMSGIEPLKGGNWKITDQLFPIPQGEILKNPNIAQNPGYQ